MIHSTKSNSNKLRSTFALLAALIFLPLFNSADAQCIKAVIKGKAVKLQQIATAASGNCPNGTVSVLKGPTGATGPTGAVGATGPQGQPGASAFSIMPSGTVVRGIIGELSKTSAGDIVYAYASIPGIIPQPLANSSIIIKANPTLLSACGSINCLTPNEQSNQSFCQGTSTNPTAAPGFLCIYPTDLNSGIVSQSLSADTLVTDDGSPTKFGFTVSYSTNSSGYSYFEGVWAYTAP